jgi:hypothetical protein
MIVSMHSTVNELSPGHQDVGGICGDVGPTASLCMNTDLSAFTQRQQRKRRKIGPPGGAPVGQT